MSASTMTCAAPTMSRNPCNVACATDGVTAFTALLPSLKRRASASDWRARRPESDPTAVKVVPASMYARQRLVGVRMPAALPAARMRLTMSTITPCTCGWPWSPR